MRRQRSFAAGTNVSVIKSRMELEALLNKYRARAVAVMTSQDHAAVVFEMSDRRIKFTVGMPPEGKERDERTRREKWRALLLSIKAKLVSVQSGIETFEDAFMAHVVMPDGSTVSENVRKTIESAYKTGKMVPLLPGPST